MNEFSARYQERGVKLLALSAEAAGTVEKFVEAQSVAYAVGIDDGGKTAKAYGVSGLPTAFVIDGEGQVVWRGHPGNHDELVAAVEGALESAGRVELPRSPHKKLAKVVEAVAAGKLGSAHKAAAALAKDAEAEAAAQAQAVATSTESLVKSRQEKAAALAEGGAWWDARRTLQRLAERLDGSDLGTALAAEVAAIDKNPAAKDDLAAGGLLEKAFKAAGDGDDGKAREVLQKLLEKYPNTKVADQARGALAG